MYALTVRSYFACFLSVYIIVFYSTEQKKSLQSKVKNLLNEKDTKIQELEASLKQMKEEIEKVVKNQQEEVGFYLKLNSIKCYFS